MVDYADYVGRYTRRLGVRGAEHSDCLRNVASVHKGMGRLTSCPGRFSLPTVEGIEEKVIVLRLYTAERLHRLNKFAAWTRGIDSDDPGTVELHDAQPGGRFAVDGVTVHLFP